MDSNLNNWNSSFNNFYEQLLIITPYSLGKEIFDKIKFYQKQGNYELRHYKVVSRRTLDECESLINSISGLILKAYDLGTLPKSMTILIGHVIEHFGESLDDFRALN